MPLLRHHGSNPMSPVLCAAESCAIPRRHVDDCPRTGCNGCLPGRAADGILLCLHCARGIGQSAARLARLYAALEKRLIHRGQAGEYTTGSSTGAPVPDDRVMGLRSEIRQALLDTATLIIQRRGVRAPVRRVTRRLPAGVEGPLRLETVATGRREHLAVFIAKHAEWVAGQKEAGEIADRLRDLSRPGGEAWRAAYSIGPQTLTVGACPLDISPFDADEPKVCGGRLEQIPDEPLITCTDCGHADTIEQWQRWLYPEGESPVVDAYAGARALSLTWFRPVAVGTIRAWASKGKVDPISVPDPSGRMTPDPDGKRDDQGQPVMVPVMVRQTDDRGRTLYRLADLVEAARRAWGDEPKVRKAA